MEREKNLPQMNLVQALPSRKIVESFSFGATAKLVSSKIWHSSATAFALDLGSIVNTSFLSPTGEAEDGLKNWNEYF